MVSDGHSVVVVDLTWVWVHRCALKQDGGGSITQRAVHHVAVARYPADIGHAAEHVAVTMVEHILKKRRTVNHLNMGP